MGAHLMLLAMQDAAASAIATSMPLSVGSLVERRSDVFNCFCAVCGNLFPALMASRPWGLALAADRAVCSTPPNQALLQQWWLLMQWWDPALTEHLKCAAGISSSLMRALSSLLCTHATPAASLRLVELGIL